MSPNSLEKSWTRSFCYLALLVTAAQAFAGCALPRRVPFNEADFAWARGAGTSTITGRAFVTMKDGTVRYAHNAMVDLVPVNAYTTESIQRYFVRGENIADFDPRLPKYRHSTMTDANGNFVLRNLPAGTYYAEASVVWHYTSTMYVNSASGDGSTVPQDYPDSTLKNVWGKVSVGKGQTAHVDLTY